MLNLLAQKGNRLINSVYASYSSMYLKAQFTKINFSVILVKYKSKQDLYIIHWQA